MKIPKYLTVAPTYWPDLYGLRRAARVAEIQAKVLRKAGFREAAEAVDELGRAFAYAIGDQKVAEAVTLNWPTEDAK